MKHTALLLALLSTVAQAADPVIRERHAAVEATLSANARKADLGKHVRRFLSGTAPKWSGSAR